MWCCVCWDNFSFPFDLRLPIFRNILAKSRELGVKTLAVCVVSTVQKNFPPDIGAHIALRKFAKFWLWWLYIFMTLFLDWLFFLSLSCFWGGIFHSLYFRYDSTLFGQIPKRNNYTLPWTTWTWNLWSASTIVFSTWYFRREQRTVATTAWYWREIWWTANFWSTNSHHS